MSTASDRRAPGMARIPFDAMVEVGGSLGPSFEARAVNLSEEGMHLRTAYLPEIGQPIMCRFDAGHGLGVVAAGEVLWRQEVGDGGEFGIRFTNLDAESAAALQRILGTAEDGASPQAMDGRKVRLHIDGLASPMRARVRDQQDICVTAYSELGFLQVGKPLDLEDANSGNRRAALIDRVDVEVDKESRIPQLVVTLRYDDTDARNAAAAMIPAEIPVHDETPRQMHESAGAEAAEDEEEDEAPAVAASVPAEAHGAEGAEGPSKLQKTLARSAAKVGPTMASWASRAKTTIALLAARARAARKGDEEAPIRRTTAPAPGGGLHTAGRKVVRGSLRDELKEEDADKPRFKFTKKKAAVAGAIGAAALLAWIALKKPAQQAPLAAAPPVDSSVAATTTTTPATLPAAAAAPPPVDPLLAAMPPAGGLSETGQDPHGKKGKPAPFTNGAVGSHGNVLRIKMDGPIDRILGASQPTGFTVVIPGRKSVDAASPLASKDSRIAALRMANEATGAELTVTFKDGVPNYVVRAASENTLELVLAKPNANGDKTPSAHAKKKHGKKHH